MIHDTGPKITLYAMAAPQIGAMSARWLDLMGLLAVEQEAARLVFADLARRYTEKSRYYHNLDHVAAVLDTLNSLRSLCQDYPAVQLAAWMHDVIYDSHASDNKAKSAAYSRWAAQQLALPDAFAARVSDLILATATHETGPGDIDAQILIDADLAPLGADEATFQAPITGAPSRIRLGI